LPSSDVLPPELQQQKKYTFLKKLGGGGMGVVYLAEHNLMKRKVAIKLIPPGLIGNPAVRERFLREVVSAAALEHENVVRAYSAEEFAPSMIFEMEYVDGKDLGAIVKSKGPLSVLHAVSYTRQAAAALQHAMLKLLVHRDIKPGNLMLTRAGSVKVADFGLAKFSRESEKGRDRSLTGINAMMGTPDFMAPEQARNAKTADIRADIYSLGCTLYFLLTGKPPFTGESLADLIFKHWEDPRPDVCQLRNDVSPELSQFIQRMMAKEPGERPQTPKDVLDGLAKFVKVDLGRKKDKPKEKTVPVIETDLREHQDLDSATSKSISPQKDFEEPNTRSKKKRTIIASAVGFLFIGLAVLFATGVIKVKTPNGTIVLQNLPSDADVTVDGTSVKVKSSEGKTFEISIPDDKKHRLEIKKEGFKVFAKEIEVDLGNSKPILVQLEPKDPELPIAAGKPDLVANPKPAPVNRMAAVGPNGQWRIEGEELVQVTREPATGILFGDPEWKDYDFSVEAMRTSGNEDISVIFRCANGLNSYWTGFGTWGNQWCEVDAAEFPQSKRVVPAVRGSVNTNEWYTILVKVRGTHVEIYLDGKLFFAFDDNRFLNGRVGMRTFRTTVRFKNIKVTDPEGAVLWEGLPDLP
jgi:serine/threonine protein kinase